MKSGVNLRLYTYNKKSTAGVYEFHGDTNVVIPTSRLSAMTYGFCIRDMAADANAVAAEKRWDCQTVHADADPAIQNVTDFTGELTALNSNFLVTDGWYKGDPQDMIQFGNSEIGPTNWIIPDATPGNDDASNWAYSRGRSYKNCVATTTTDADTTELEF